MVKPQAVTLILTAGLCGLRWAELVGLQVQDIALDASFIIVRRSLSEVNGKFHANLTKTGQSRTVSVPESLQSDLLQLIQGKTATDLVFANSLGKPLSAGNFNTRVLKPALQIAGIPRITMQELRHTCASIMISAGANVMAIANAMGHSDPTITLKRYAHLYSDDRNSVAEAVETLMSQVL